MRTDLEWQIWTWTVNWSQASTSSSTDWWQSGKWHEPQQREWQDPLWWEEINTVSLIHQSFCKILAHSCFFIRVQTLANVVQSTGSEDRTPRRTHRTRGTQAKIFSRTRDTLPTLSRMLKCELYCALCPSEVIPSHACFIAPCLMHSCPHPSLHFSGTGCSLQRVHQPLALRKEGCSLASGRAKPSHLGR